MQETQAIMRERLRQQRRALSASTQQQASQNICHTLQTLPLFHHARSIALYHATENEPDVFPLMHADKVLLLPVVTPTKTLCFYPFQTGDPLTQNRYGILEPVTQKNPVLPQHIDVILVPFVSFDSAGNRLGRGAGYYDRTLCFMQHAPKTQKPHLIGIGYEFQKMPTLQPNPWDIALHCIVTEQACYGSVT